MSKRKDIKPLPSSERLNELFVYEPLTGYLRWRSIPANFQRANIGLNGEQRKLGRFKLKEDAVAARVKAAEELHGQFMRVS